VGFGCGLGLCALPLYLAETAPPQLRDRVGALIYPMPTMRPCIYCLIVGVLNQLSVTVGILVTQAVGLPLAKQSNWRLVFTISSCLGVVHAATGMFIHDTPAWLSAKGRHSEALRVSSLLKGSKDIPVAHHYADTEQDSAHDDRNSDLASLLPHQPAEPTSSEPLNAISLIRRPDLRQAVLIVLFAMLAQQGSGINAGLSETSSRRRLLFSSSCSDIL
jgi:MFS family permease